MTSLYLLHVMCVWRCEASSARESGYSTGSMESLETYEVPSCIRGHHVYRDIWSPQYLSDITQLTPSLARSTSACDSEDEAHMETVGRAGRSKSLR